MSTTTTSPVFTEREPVDVELERPFRPSSILALLLGLLSASMVASPNLVFIPILAVAISVFALRPARQANVKPSGRSLAWLGMILAFFFAAWSVSYFTIRYQQLTSAAQTFAIDWLELLNRGEKELAFELSQTPSMRQVDNMALKEFYSQESEPNRPNFERYDSFLRFQAVSAILAAETKPKWEYVETSSIYRQYEGEYVVLNLKDTTNTIRPITVIMGRLPTINDQGELDLNAPRQWFAKSVSFTDGL